MTKTLAEVSKALTVVAPLMQLTADDSGIIPETREAARLLAAIGWKTREKQLEKMKAFDRIRTNLLPLLYLTIAMDLGLIILRITTKT